MNHDTDAPTTAITITYRHAEGVLIHGTARGDGAADVLRRERARYSRSLDCWYLPYSRDRAPRTDRIDALATALRAAGFAVEVTIDPGVPRPVAEVEAERLARANQRATRHAEAAEAAQQRADAALERRTRITNAIPFGQPILVGHHSEARHRRDLKRAETELAHAIEDHRRAEDHARLARAAASRTQPQGPQQITRRLERLRAEARHLQRALNGHTRTLYTSPVTGERVVEVTKPATGADVERYQGMLAETNANIAYWQGELKKCQLAGAVVFSRAIIKSGDLVAVAGEWYRVLRANPKTVTVDMPPGWDRRVPYTRITGHKTSPAT